MSETTKSPSEYSEQQIMQRSFNKEGHTLGVDGFIVGKLGRKIIRSDVTSSSEDFAFYDSTTLLYTIRITYTDSSKSTLSQVERVA